MSLNSMSQRYIQECQRRGLPALSADELELELELSLQGEPTQISDAHSKEVKGEHLDWVKRFRATWERVEGEQRKIQILCIEALKHGYRFHQVDDGEEVHSIADGSVAEVIELAMAVDESKIRFKGALTGTVLSFYLVFGNSPEELIADHTEHPDAELIWQAVQARS